MQKRGVCQGGKGGALALAPPSAGVLPAGRRTERGRPKAAPWGTIFPDPISFDSAKRNGVGPPKKSAVLVLRCVPFNDRRIRAGYTKHPLPLPLHNAMFPCTHPNRLRLVCLAFPADAPSRCTAAAGADKSEHSVGPPGHAPGAEVTALPILRAA